MEENRKCPIEGCTNQRKKKGNRASGIKLRGHCEMHRRLFRENNINDTPNPIKELMNDTKDWEEEFDRKSDILFTNGGLSALQDYPPHERVYDDMALKDFIREEKQRTREATLESVRETIKSMKAEFPRYMIIEDNARESVAAIVHEVKQQLLKALQTLPTEDSN